MSGQQALKRSITVSNAYMNEGTETVDIRVDGEIGYRSWWSDESEDSVLTASEMRDELNEITSISAKRIRVYINSLGGSVNHALNMHDALVAHPAEVVTIVEGGMSASAASFIFAAGDKRLISENALFLVHQSLISPWDYSFNSNALKELLSTTEAIDKRIKALYARIGVDMKDSEELMNANNGDGKWLSGEETKSYGFATEVISPKGLLTANYKTRLQKQKLPPVPANILINSSKPTKKMDGKDNKGFFKNVFKNLFGEGATEESVKNDLTKVADKLKASKQEVEGLKAKIESLTNDLNETKSLHEENETKLTDLKAKVADLDSKNTQLNTDLTDAKKAKEDSVKEIETLKATVANLERKNGTPTPTPEKVDPLVDSNNVVTAKTGEGADSVASFIRSENGNGRFRRVKGK